MATARRRVLRLANGEEKQIEDEIAVDIPVELYVENNLLRTFWASPGMERELAVGHLLAEGIIDAISEVEAMVQDSKVFITLKNDRQLRLETSKVYQNIKTACGGEVSGTSSLLDRLRKPKVTSRLRVNTDAVQKMVEELNSRARVFKATGGTHSAMLCTDTGEVLAYAEDVGRHNAVDKVIGKLALEGRPFSDCVLVSSGRQPSDMVLKSARVGIPIVVSQAAPLESGVKAAEERGVTLICFVRGRRMNVYTHSKRVLADGETQSF